MHSHSILVSLSTLTTLFLSVTALPANNDIDLMARDPYTPSWVNLPPYRPPPSLLIVFQSLDCGKSSLTGFCNVSDQASCDAAGNLYHAGLMDPRCNVCACRPPPPPQVGPVAVDGQLPAITTPTPAPVPVSTILN